MALYSLLIIFTSFLGGGVCAEPETQVLTLQQLSAEYATWLSDRQGQAYLDLLNSTDALQQAININPDIELIYVETNGEPFYYTINNLNAAKTISTDDVWPGGSTGLNLNGTGTSSGKLGIWDAGAVLTTHQEFDGRASIGDGTSTTHYHSTHVGGTMVAEGQDANAKGMSFVANLKSYNWNSDESEMATAAAEGMNVSNHSYGHLCGWAYVWNGSSYQWVWYGNSSISSIEDYKFGFYYSSAQHADNIASNAPYFLICKSAGNDRNDYGISGSEHEPDGGVDGYDCIPTTGNAKNILLVGAVGDIPAGYSTPGGVVMESYSGWGPTDDGRIKPDIVANGNGLNSCSDAGNASYTILSGTSMATPNASGSANLLFRQYEALNGGQAPLASTIKGIMIQTADEAGPNDGPDYMFGWGLMNTKKAAELIAANATELRIVEDELTNGETDEIYFYSPGTQQIRMSLCWTDLPGTPPAASLDPTTLMLVNDLDMRIEHISSSTVYSPYVLDPANPGQAATSGDNFRDNVEQIYVAAPQSGVYKVSISHKGTMSPGQYYSLISSIPLGDRDNDGILDDGDFSGVVGDNKCTGGATANCDDNCLTTYNPTQADADNDGIGDACDSYTVRNVPSQYSTIQAAINACQDGDHVVVSTGTFTGTGNVNISFLGKDITVRSVLGPDYTTIDCGGTGSENRGFEFVNGETSAARLEGFTIRNGDPRNRQINFVWDRHGGAIKIKSASPTIVNCNFKDNYAHLGGAVHCMKTVGEPDNVYPTFSNCVFENNHSNHPTLTGDNGGGILFINSHPTFTNCAFIDNVAAEYGGAVYAITSTGTFTGCTFTGNHSLPSHGGTVLSSASTLDFNRSIIANTTAGYGISAWSSSVITMDCSDFWNNTPQNYSMNSSSINLGNTIFANPYFCDAAAGEYTIVENSPCAAAHSPCGQQIGKYGVGCEAPEVGGIFPASYTVGPAAHAEVLCIFEEEMDPTSFNSGTFKVFSRTDGQVSGDYLNSPSPYWYWFDPAQDHRAGEIVTYVLTDQVTNADGFPIEKPYVGTYMVRTSSSSYGTLGNQTLLTAGNKPVGVYPADLDGDGDIDLAVPNHDSHNISIYLNAGDGSFAPQVLYPAGGTNPWDVTARDFDGDGDLDLATSNYGSQTVSVYFNNGSGVFTTGASYGAGARPHPILSEDIDGDGDFDLIAANLNSDNISVYLNDGDGSFTDQVTYYVGDGPIGLAGADYDRDGDIDIFTSNYHGSTIGLLDNNGDGTFAVAQQLSMGASGPFNIVAIDMSGDGRVDLATANRGSDDVSVLIQTTGGVFGAAAVYDAGTDPYYVCPADLDGDSRIDLVSANLNSDDLSVYINNGNGTFGAQQRYSVGDGPLWLCAADFNNDEMVDIAVANAFSHTISILDNTDDIGPQLVSPLSGYSTYSHSITLNWADYTEATSYEVVVDGDPNFGSIDRQITGLVPSQWLISPNLGHGKFYWKVRAQTAGGPSSWSTVWHFTIMDYPTSCPVLFTNDGSQFIKDNPLLTACEKSGYADIVTDYYLVSQSVANRDGAVSFQLRELEDEITSLYDLELLVVDHSDQSKIACAPDGNITTYTGTIAPVSVVDNLGRDQLAAVTSQDGVRFASSEAGWLEITFETSELPSTAGVDGGIILDVPPKPLCPIIDKEGQATKSIPGNETADTNVDVSVEYKNAGGEWEVLPAIPPRAAIGQEALMTPGESETVTIRISWTEFYSTDCIQYFVPGNEQPGVTNRAINLGSVTSAGKNAAWTGFTKGSPLVLHKGDIFEFTFETGALPAEGMTRDYIIRSVGRYQPDYEIFTAHAPSTPQLHGNFPNPFNPATTISYDLPSDAEVSLIVYNVLGQRVAMLVNDRQSVGSYEVVWSGKDDRGAPVSSGIYFYKLTVGEYTESKKMLLLK